VFTLVGHQAWWLCGEIEGKQRNHAVQESTQEALHCSHVEQQRLQ